MFNRTFNCRRIAVALSILSIFGNSAAAAAEGLLVTNTYTGSAEEFANPERGFYFHTETRASNPSPVPANLVNLRINGSRDPNNAYLTHITLVLRVFYLDSFADAPISPNYLQVIHSDFASIRNQGLKAVVRFAYFQNPNRPFPEPTKARILEHIQQLTPLLRENRDVIAVLQQGFIGAWGEGYYTDIFSTAGQTFTAQNWRDRADVIQALLDAVPAERMIQVRVPQQRQKFLHGPAAPTGTAADSAAAMFDGSATARLGFHNDCFLADPSDAGTFSDYDGTTDAQVMARLRAYQAQETQFTVMGGETCVENNPDDNCAVNGGRADSDLARFHYSFLNQGYNANVNDDWVAQGCLDDIKRRLGYRLELVSSTFPDTSQAGESIPVRIDLRNVGYAAPFNPRGIELILRNVASGKRYFAELSRDVDARRWLPGTNHSIQATLLLPPDLPAARYEILLHLPDPSPALYGQVPYSIRLANSTALDPDGVALGPLWESSTGYNHLGHIIAVSGPISNATPVTSAIPVLPYSAVRETFDTWRERNFPTGSTQGDPGVDADWDGWQNLAEYATGTDPNSAVDRPAVASMTEEGLVLMITKPPGVKDVRYAVEGSASLSPALWSTHVVTVLTDDAMHFRARFTGSNGIGFLRLQVHQVPP